MIEWIKYTNRFSIEFIHCCISIEMEGTVSYEWDVTVRTNIGTANEGAGV